MGGEGSMMAANQSLKNNRALRNQRRKGKFSFVSSVNEKWEDPKKATFEQLMEIRHRIRRERKRYHLKIAMVVVIMFIAIIFLTIFVDWGLLFGGSSV